eukprot:TRINITY_DN11822_c0_g1_i1.p1 TRINITY_DN11822_c0_g1~~TRINITY_DN11822_c0_g1_i1.p1  ORF type:complete len:146 (-),score=32.53 TRINITY_DN11822_c0_g1_i1:2-439(-)
MIRRPPRSTQSRSSAASDVYKRQSTTSTRSIRSPWAPGSFNNETMTIAVIADNISVPELVVERGATLEQVLQQAHENGGTVAAGEVMGSSEFIPVTTSIDRSTVLTELSVCPGDCLYFESDPPEQTDGGTSAAIPRSGSCGSSCA